MRENYDFCGWATRNDIKCSDGRTIRKNAFIDNDGTKVPLVWNHGHDSSQEVLGHALLENRDEGVYAYGYFNDTENGQNAKKLVEHGDVTALSIYANKLKQHGGDVLHGAIREVSLVLASANPGAYIENVVIQHGEDLDELEDEVFIYSGEDIMLHAEEPKEPVQVEKETKVEVKKEDKPMPGKERTVGEVFNEFSEEQKNVVYAIVGQAVADALEEAGVSGEGEDNMKHNVFDNDDFEGDFLSHADMEEIFTDAKRMGSLKDSVLAHTDNYGIAPIDYLFPDYKNLNNAPDFIDRPQEWVGQVMGAVKHTPFARIKTMHADITEDEARALGYIKGKRKKEEFFTLIKRTTDPQTVYKKQKLDRDDIIDITDFDVVAWLKAEMRGKLDEEIARARLVGDGRNTASDDKIEEAHIRPIWKDDDLYTIKQRITVPAGSSSDTKAKAFIRGAIKARKNYRGSGNPVCYMTEDLLTDCLLITDEMGRDLYESQEKLATKLRVSKIVTVPVMENLFRTEGNKSLELMAIIVNLSDYNIGADKGGAVNMFDDFDIDYNQQKYLIETRCSGALVKPYSAIAVELDYAASLIIDPKDDNASILGKAVADLQSGIIVNNNSIEGTLNYVTDYTGFSGDPEEQEGNYLALQFDAAEGSTTTIELIGGNHPGAKPLDADMDAVFRITKNTQKIKVVTTAATGEVIERTLSLGRLNLEK